MNERTWCEHCPPTGYCSMCGQGDDDDSPDADGAAMISALRYIVGLSLVGISLTGFVVMLVV